MGWDGDSGLSDVTAHDSPGCWSWSEKKEDLEARLLFQKEGMGMILRAPKQRDRWT